MLSIDTGTPLIVVVDVMKENLLESIVKCKVSIYTSIIRLFKKKKGSKMTRKRKDVYKYLLGVCQAEVK